MLRKRLVPALALSTALTASLLVGAAAPASGAGFPETVPLRAGSSPEGIAGGPGTTYFAGSRKDGSIAKGDLRTGDAMVLVEGTDGGQAVGMQYEAGRQRLWVAGGATGTVTAYDARTGALLAQYDVPGAGFLNDVAVTKGAVYVTDSFRPELTVVPLGRGGALPEDATQLALTGDFTQPQGFGANGLRSLPDGGLVMVSSGGGLFRVDTTTGATDEIEVLGGARTGGDGLELRGDTLWVVFAYGQDQIAEFRLSDGATSAQFTRLLDEPEFDRPTTATFAAGALWAVNGRFGLDSDEVEDEGTEDPANGFSVVRVAL